MSFGDAIRSGFKNFAKFEGRARRSEYWFWQLFMVLVYLGIYVVIGLLMSAISETSSSSRVVVGLVGLISIGALIALFVPSLSVLVRRLHDTGRSGAYYFMSWIPLVGGIFMLVYTLEDSRPGKNAFGDFPKA